MKQPFNFLKLIFLPAFRFIFRRIFPLIFSFFLPIFCTLPLFAAAEKETVPEHVPQTLSLEIAQISDSGLAFVPLPTAWKSCETAVSCGSSEIPVSAQYIRLGTSACAAFQFPPELVELSRTQILKLTLRPVSGSEFTPKPVPRVEISTPVFRLTQDVCHFGALPSRLTFTASGRTLDALSWEERLFDGLNTPENSAFSGVWMLTADPSPTLEILSDGPVCTVVRQTARFARRNTSQSVSLSDSLPASPSVSFPPSEPAAVYDWFFFKNSEGIIFARVSVVQKTPHTWKELHLGELHVNDAALPQWHGHDSVVNAKKMYSGTLTPSAEKVRMSYSCGAALSDGKNTLRMFAPEVLFYGDAAGKRVYLHAAPSDAWKGWNSAQPAVRSFLLQVQTRENTLAEDFPETRLQSGYFRWDADTSDWREAVRFAQRFTDSSSGSEKDPPDVQTPSVFTQTPVSEQNSTPFSSFSETWTAENADLAAVLTLREAPDGGKSVSLDALADVKTGFLFTKTPQDLFTLEVETVKAPEDIKTERDTESEKDAKTGNDAENTEAVKNAGNTERGKTQIPVSGSVFTRTQTLLTSRSSWREITREGNTLTFTGPLAFPDAPKLWVRITLDTGSDSDSDSDSDSNSGSDSNSDSDSGMNSDSNAFRFQLSTASETPSVRPLSASVGRIYIENTGLKMNAIHPGACGTLIPQPAASGVRLDATYPSLGAVMPWLAVWDSDRKTGLYVANLDATGAVKNIHLENPSDSGNVLLEIRQPLPLSPDSAQVGTETRFAGTVVWQRLDGDWYDAAILYRDWVRRYAGWYPKLGPEGRVSTPLWMKRMCVWCRVFGDAANVVPAVKTFCETLDVPVGVHWYQWHEIPFDNDYPHYFPAKPGFKEGVQALHALGCRVVPYTNGRLWDTRDRKNEDYAFTARGLAGSAKKTDGTPFTESYRSLEIDGSKVVFAVMCPGSKVWKDTIAENNRRLIQEYGLDGVYMDQISCAHPILCEDASHGHFLRGGSWWSEEYRNLLMNARRQIEGKNAPDSAVTPDSPKDYIFSSESNVETCANDIDGMVCWHIEGNHVPAWCVIYSGTVFPYGRAYDGNTRAMRMKWANNLVNGDQPGWFPPQFAQNPELGPYLRKLVRFRFHTVEYFYKGELLRAPRLTAENLPVWSEEWNVFGRHSVNTLCTVQTAARRILTYDYDSEGNRLWETGKVERALLIFTNYSDEDVLSPLKPDWKDLGFTPETAVLERVDAEGNRTPLTLEALQRPVLFPAGETWGIEISPR